MEAKVDRTPTAARSGPRRVCCFCERWESGGIESFLCNILTRMDLSQMQVDIVAASLGQSVFTDRLRERGVGFYELSGSLRKMGKNHKLFRRLLKERQYDVLHVNAFQGLSLAYLDIARQEGVPIRIAHSHNTALRKSLARPAKLWLHNRGKNKYTPAATHLWACSAPAAQFLFSEKLWQTFRWIPNGVETDRFRYQEDARCEVRAQLGLEDALVVGNVGRLCYQKNQDFLLDVFAHFHTRRPDSRLLLVGEGEDREALEEKVKALGLEKAVIFYGTSNQVERLLWAMDLLAFPSRFEGLSVAAVEAQAAGLPILASDSVPGETKVLPLYTALPLEAGAQVWSDRLEELAHIETDRPASAEAVKAAGFEVSEIAGDIQRFWMGA